MAILDVIQECHVFKRLSSEQCQKLVSISREETYQGGEYVFRQGDQAQSLYVVEEGEVVLQLDLAPSPGQGPPQWATLDIIKKGQAFGWSAIVEPHGFTTSAQAIQRCKCVAIDGVQLLNLMESDSILGYRVLKELSQVIASRLVRTRQALLTERGVTIMRDEHGY